jgi:hypothetical protein
MAKNGTKTGGGDFLGRWSRRKLGEAAGAPANETPKPESAQPVVPAARTEDQGDPEVVAQLPDIDGMDDSSDFTVFLQAGVPEALRRRALRKLWRVNPVLANLDGLNDYDEDYTQLHTLGRGMKSLYKAGKGFVADESEAPAAGAPPQTAETLPPDSSPPGSPPESPAADESETQRAESPPAHTARHVAPAKPVAAPRKTARSRRWGPPDTQN